MTQQEFIKILDSKGYSYEIKGFDIIINNQGFIDLKIIKNPSKRSSV